MTAMTERFNSAPRTRTSGAALRFGRAALLAGWVVFALGTTLSTCIQAFAAPAGEPAWNVAAAFASVPADHRFGGESLPAESVDDGFKSSCCHVASAMPRNEDVPLALATNDSPSWWAAIEGVAPPSLVRFIPSKSLLRVENPPPPRRLYLRTLRLLI